MKFYSFDDYWKNHGKYLWEVIKNPCELEEDFYNLCKKIWQDSRATKEESYDIGYSEGWDACRDKVLGILEKPLKNLDLSEDECDSRYIEEIKDL